MRESTEPLHCAPRKAAWGISGQAFSELHQAKETGIKGTRVCWLTSLGLSCECQVPHSLRLPPDYIEPPVARAHTAGSTVGGITQETQRVACLVVREPLTSQLVP